MNFTESFNEFSSKLGPMDLALYAGVGIVLWVLFKEKVNPVKELVVKLFNGVSGKLTDTVVKPVAVVTTTPTTPTTDNQQLFFDLVVSWKQTRDLAEKSGCSKAVEVADQMFPYLSPMVCTKEEK